jgi:hypothetical protein
MSNPHQGGILATSKFSKGRHSNSRSLSDGAHKEALDLWEFSTGRLHSAGGVKGTIANYVNLGQRKNMESIPFATFKNDMYPHSYMTASIDPNAEPTSQPIAGRLTDIERWGLKKSTHLLPPDYLHDNAANTYASGRDDIMRAGKTRRYKTSYAKATARKTPYQRTDRTSSTLATSNSAQAGKSANSSIATAGVPEQTGAVVDANGKLVGSGSSDLLTPDSVQAIKRLAVKLARYATGSGPGIKGSDPDLLQLTQSGLDPATLRNLIQKHPSLSSLPGIGTLIRVLTTNLGLGVTLADVFSGAAEFGSAFSGAGKSKPEEETTPP